MRYLFGFLSLRYWMRHRGGFVLAALGVALGLAVFVSIQIANHSVLASFAASLDAVSGKANLQIRGGPNGLPDDVYARIKNLDDPAIKAAAPLLTRTLYCPTLHSSLLLLGVDLLAEVDFQEFDPDSDSSATQPAAPGAPQGDTPRQFLRFLVDPRAIAISQKLADKGHLKVGSSIDVFVGAKRQQFRVAAILRSAPAQQAFGGDFALLDIAAAQEAFGAIGRLSQIDLIVDENRLDSLQARLRPLAPADARVQRPAQRGAEVAGLLGAFQLNLSALSCISVFVGAFLIYNAIAIAVVRRRSEVGILRAIGTDRRRILQLFLIEAAFIGLAGSFAGLGLGILMARFSLQAVARTVTALYIAVPAQQLSIPVWLWWGAPLGGTLLAVVSAYPAAREASHTSPRAALLRITLHHATARFAAPMAGAGAVALLIAWVLCRPTLSSQSLYTGFAAAFLTLAGFALLTPLITLWGGMAIQKGATRIGGIEGTLAAAYLQRALHRSSLVIAALMVSLAMTVGLSAMVRSFRVTVAGWVETSINADLFIAPAAGLFGDDGPGLPPDVVEFARHLPGVAVFDTVRGADITFHNQPVFIAANVQPSLTSGRRHTRFVETVGTETAAKQAYEQGKAILVSERFMNLLGYRAGDTLTLTTPIGPHSFFIAGVFYDYTPNQCLIYMPQAVYRRLWNDWGIDAIALYLERGASADKIQRAFEQKFASRYQLTLLPNQKIRAQVFDTFDNTFRVTYALQLMAVLVAALGIFDTLIALLLERGRELATLRALGAGPGQIHKMTLIEFALIGFFAWAIGMAAGLSLAWELIHVINRQFFGWTIYWSLPLSILWQALGLALLAAVGAGLLPAQAAIRRNVAEALQTE